MYIFPVFFVICIVFCYISYYSALSGKNFTKYDSTNGMNDIIKSVFMIPIFCATKPIKGRNTPTIPQLNPPMKPEIMLLYCGIVFCAMTMFIDTESIVMKPVSTKRPKDKTGAVFTMLKNINVSINGTIKEV